jgi:hypothetical protein
MSDSDDFLQYSENMATAHMTRTARILEKPRHTSLHLDSPRL